MGAARTADVFPASSRTQREPAEAIGITLRRAGFGYLLAIVIGMAIGLAIVRWRLLRTAVASLITGLQTMPSIAWFPLAILLFGLSEAAIMFVIVLGAAPSIANGLINGVDHVPRILCGPAGCSAPGVSPLPVRRPAGGPAVLRRRHEAGLGLRLAQPHGRGAARDHRPAAVDRRPLQLQRDLSDAEALLATMVVILAIGIFVDLALFGTLDRRIRTRWGLVETP